MSAPSASSSSANSVPTIEQAMAEITRLREVEQRGIHELAQLQQQLRAGEAQRVASAAAAQGDAHAAAAQSRHAIKLPSPEKFKGAMGQEVIRWIRQIEHQFNVFAAEYPVHQPARRIMLATAFFSGTAESWWRNLSDQDKARCSGSWDEFVEALRDRFSPIQAAEFARARLFSLRQSQCGSLGAFIEKFLEELTPIQDEMHEHDQIYHFRNGLKDSRVLQKVIEHKPDSLTDAIKLATTWDAHFSSVSRMGNVGNYFRGGGPSSYGARVPSYSSSSVPMEVSAVQGHAHVQGDEEESPSQEAALDSSNPLLVEMMNKLSMLEKSHLAMIGHGSGHNSSAHRGNKFGNRRDHTRIPGLKPNDIADRRRANECFRCGNKGHWKNECPQLHANKSLKD